MAVERESAVISNQIILRNNFRYAQTQSLFDPSAISKVEILDSDGTTILETLTGASIIKDSVGKYHVTATAIAVAKTIYDRWSFTPTAGAMEIAAVNTCIVWQTAAAAGTPVLDTTNAGMLAAVNQDIATRLAGGAVQSYGINNRNLQYCTLDELYKLKTNLEKAIAAASGRGRTYAKFVRTD